MFYKNKYFGNLIFDNLNKIKKIIFYISQKHKFKIKKIVNSFYVIY